MMNTAFNEPKYDIAASDYHCRQCTSEIEQDNPYYSSVVFAEGQFERRNYCSACWAKGRRSSEEAAEQLQIDGVDVFAHWRTRRPAPPMTARPKRPRFDPEVIMQFFLRLGGVDPSEVEAATEENESPEESVVSSTDSDSEAAVAPDTQSSMDETQREELRFFLSLLLIRRKWLTIKSTLYRDGEEWLVLNERRTPNSSHSVRNPQLSENRLAGLKDRIGDLLEMQL